MKRETKWSGIGDDSAGNIPGHERNAHAFRSGRSGIGNDSVGEHSGGKRNADAFRSGRNGIGNDSVLRRGRMTRLSAEYYHGHAFVHWNMAIDARAAGWLTPAFHVRFREIQLHTLARHRLLCLVHCLMPDHLHVLWAGLSPASDQDRAATFFRRYLNQALADADGTLTRSAPGKIGAESVTIPSGTTPQPHGTLTRSAPCRLQKQTWDVVLRDKDLERDAIERLLFYITENPVRAGLVGDAGQWPYSGAQAAGYPELDWRQTDFTKKLWKIYWQERERFGAESVTIPSGDVRTKTERSRVPLQSGAESVTIPPA